MSHGQPPGPPYAHPGHVPGAQPPPYGPPGPYYAPPPYGPHNPHNPYGPPGPPGPYAGAPAPARPRRRPEAPVGGPVEDEDERWAVPAYIGMFVSGFIAPMVVLMVKGRTSPFARFHAVQALNLFVVMFTGTFLALLLMYSRGPGWLPLVLAILAGDCLFVIRAAIGANRCEWYRLPAAVAWRIFR